jgi:hypothetical protein
MPSKKQARPSIPEVLGYVSKPSHNGWEKNQGLLALANRLDNINKRYRDIKESDESIGRDLYNELHGDFSTLIENQRSGIVNESLLKRIENRLSIGGGRRHRDTMTMKEIRQLCKDNQIKLSRVVNDKRVVYKKKELLTKLKRKKVV